jgi:ABC-type Zn uptake system ZnuABC Zn-binding protein ZnuA
VRYYLDGRLYWEGGYELFERHFIIDDPLLPSNVYFSGWSAPRTVSGNRVRVLNDRLGRPCFTMPADTVVLSGAGLEEFMHDLLAGREVIDASAGIPLLGCEHEHHGDDHHHHEADSHIWLSPENARVMSANICAGLEAKYPQHAERFRENLGKLTTDIQALADYGKTQLSSLSCRDLITFHDGFAYFAQSFDLHILAAVEEESGSEASARELKELIGLIEANSLPAIFTEKSGSVSAAGIISRETGVQIFQLDMAMAGNSWFESMYHNIDTIKEALS